MQLAEYIPPAWYPFLLAWATYLLDLYQRLYAQLGRTFGAILQSFSDEVVGFTDDSMLPYPLSQETRGVQFYDANVYCVYNLTKGLIKIVDRNRPHTYQRWNSSWLAISVATEDRQLGDLSAWLEGVRVEHNLEPLYVLHWLLLCYAYATHTELKYMDIERYRFSVITQEAEEKVINWREEVIDVEETPTDQTSTQDSSAQETFSQEEVSESETTDVVQSEAVSQPVVDA